MARTVDLDVILQLMDERGNELFELLRRAEKRGDRETARIHLEQYLAVGNLRVEIAQRLGGK